MTDVGHVIEQVAALADACRTCGRAHQRRPNPRSEFGLMTWRDPGDGHAYRRTMPAGVAAWLRGPVATTLGVDVMEG